MRINKFLALVVLCTAMSFGALATPKPTAERSRTGAVVRKGVAIRAVVVPYNGAVGGNHSVTLTWTASASASSCTATGNPPCTFGYNVYRGTVAGQESVTPINASLITGLTFVDSSITLQASPVTYYYVVQAVETVAETTGSIVSPSANSNEVSAPFPGIPQAPVLASPATN